MLGLRDGFCGALSSFSSWQSSMVSLMRNGRFGEAFTGYMLGIQLPLIAYRTGQTVAVYIFIWRCRWETRRDTRRGYGIRVNQEGSDSETSDHEQEDHEEEERVRRLPSVRAVATAIFVVALITQVTSLFFYNTPEHQLLALSLLFSPLGVFSRWRLSRLNSWRSTFPLGTFTCNIIACALSGSLGRLLAGNPNPRQRIVLQSIVAGFGATLSSLAAFIVEILAGIDPILFRFDGLFYAVMSVGCGMFASYIFGSTGEWADQTESKQEAFNYTDDMANATDVGGRWLMLSYI
jgi:fluoride ion exporter CrcB/FEX